MKNKYLCIAFIVMLIAVFWLASFSNVYAYPVAQVPPDESTWLTSSKVSCGPVTNIPAKVPEIFSLLILLFEIAVPVILVIIGMIDLSKGVMSQKEDEIKKGQQTFIKRLIAGALIFFIVALVKLLVGVVGGKSGNKIGIVDCMDCFLNGECTEMGTGSSDDPSIDDPTDPNTSMENFH